MPTMNFFLWAWKGVVIYMYSTTIFIQYLWSYLVSIWTFSEQISHDLRSNWRGNWVYWPKAFQAFGRTVWRYLVLFFSHHSSRHPLRHDKHTYISCNVMSFINNAAQPLGDCGGWRIAMWCLIIMGTWEIKSVESTQHPPQSLMPLITSSNLSSFLFFPLT